jgi:hypothetical protein
MDKPEAKQLYYGIVNYMVSDKFNPNDIMSIEQLKELL